MKKTIRTIAIALATATALMTASAQNAFITGTGLTTTWSGTPTLNTGLPTVFTISENAYTGASPSVIPMLGQTFTATTSGTLADIQIYAGGAPGDNYIYLWDLGAASSYAAVSGGSTPASLLNLPNYPTFSYVNLFSPGSYFTFGGGGQSVRILTFTDTVSITAGDLYYFGIAPSLLSAVMSWQRVSTDPYAGGAAYREGGVLNGTAVRDFGMAVDVTPVPEPSTLALMSLVGGAALMGWRRNRR
jgi:hypothetical protein